MQLRLLGPTELEIDGELIALGGPRQRAVLADLALHAPLAVPVGRLVGDIWGEFPPSSAVHTLEAYISRLRRVLVGASRSPLLIRRGDGYALLFDRSEVDVLDFADALARAREALARDDLPAAATLAAQALERWRGTALSDLHAATFTHATATHLERQRMLAVEIRSEAELGLGNNHDVVAWSTAAVLDMPFHERFHHQLMLALYRSGRAVDALAHFQQTRRTFIDELGLEPGPELRRLEQDILDHAPGLAPPTRAGLPMTLPSTARRPDDGVNEQPLSTVRRRVLDVEGRGVRPRWLIALVAVAIVASGLPALVSHRSQDRPVPVDDGVTELTGSQARVVRSVGLPGVAGGVATGDAATWVTSPENHSLYRVDARTGSEQVIPVGAGAGAVAVSGSDVWVANTLDSTVSRVSANTLTVVQTIAVGSEPTGIATAGGDVWVADSSAETVTRIDATSGTVQATVALSVAPYDVALGHGSVWLSDPGSDSVSRMDPSTRSVRSIPVGAGPSVLSYAFGSVWVTNTLGGTVSRIDPHTDSVVATIRVGADPDGLAVMDGSMWVADRLSSQLTMVRPHADLAGNTIPVAGSPVGMASSGGDLWVGTRPGAPAVHRGTLRVDMSVAPTSIDPARSYPDLPFQFSEGIYDSLLTYNRVGGGAGLQLVPDLAVSMPRMSDDGTEYTFTIRSGIHYSNGQVLAPRDFRHGIERVMKLNPSAASFFAGLVGAGACRPGSACHLSHGITTSADTVSFHLTRPDVDFDYALAMPFAAPVPASVPDHDSVWHPVPSTGPYAIAHAAAGDDVVAVRNPYFSQWSAGAEPDGGPAQIIWRFGRSVAQEVRQISDGRADWIADAVPDPAELAAQLPTQVHSNPNSTVVYAAFNTRVPPFNEVQVRRAFSFAANRAELAAQLGGPDAATPTCQILPPGIPGHRAFCPFTVDPNARGKWVGPDLTAARRLVARSGTEGMPVVIWGQQSEPAVNAFMVRVLNQLGYRTTVVTPSPRVLSAAVDDSRYHIQATDGDWTADYPAASDFLSLFFRCSSFRLADPAATRNGSFFCDPELDRLMNDAVAQEATMPALADATWADVDRGVTRLAPWVPLVDTTWTDVLSTRVTGYQYNPAVGVLLDQLSISR